jgi:hypothetical protein
VLRNTGCARQFSNHAERTSCKNLSLVLRFRTPDLTQGELDRICNEAQVNSPEPFVQRFRIVPVATTERADSCAGDCLQANSGPDVNVQARLPGFKINFDASWLDAADSGSHAEAEFRQQHINYLPLPTMEYSHASSAGSNRVCS